MRVYRIPADLAELRDRLSELEHGGDEAKCAVVPANVDVARLARPPRPGAGSGRAAFRCPHCGATSGMPEVARS